VDPSLIQKVPEAHYNSGDGLDAFDARQLAFKLAEEIKNGRTDQYIVDYYKSLEVLPKEPCRMILEDHANCDLCSGSGETEPFEKNYHIDAKNVVEFKEFLMDCGGFSIC
jgi:hypothetical protein